MTKITRSTPSLESKLWFSLKIARLNQVLDGGNVGGGLVVPDVHSIPIVLFGDHACTSADS